MSVKIVSQRTCRLDGHRKVKSYVAWVAMEGVTTCPEKTIESVLRESVLRYAVQSEFGIIIFYNQLK